MDERTYLHDHETLLASRHPSLAFFLSGLLVGFAEGAMLSALLSGLIFAGFSLGLGWGIHWSVYVIVTVLCFLLVGSLHWRHWKHALFRVTTERILIDYHKNLFTHVMKTIKWNQYQESHTGHRTPLDVFFGSHPLYIRYGTPDAQKEAYFPSLRHANDLKHYLDKVDTAERKNMLGEIRPFVAKPRGKRY